MMMACCSILVWGLVACGEKKAETSQDQKTEVEQTAKTEDEVAAKTDTEETVDEPNDGKSAEPISLSDLQKTLVKQTLQVPKSISDPKARDFAQVFCEKYPAFGANALLLKYLQNPKAFNPKATVSMTLSTENAKIVDDRPNGFLKCEKYALFDNQDDETFEACRWMRKNGHSLVGVFMHSSNDAGLNHHAYAFYDFDPLLMRGASSLPRSKFINSSRINHTFISPHLALQSFKLAFGISIKMNDFHSFLNLDCANN